MQKINYGNVLLTSGIILLVTSLIGTKKTTKVIITSENPNVKTFPGYTITNCKDITITNAQQAFNYAINVGKTENPEKLYEKLFANCLDYLSPNSLRKAYDLMAYAGAGGIVGNDINIDSVVLALEHIKDTAKKYIDISDFPKDSKQYVLNIKV